jgi:hypothetical protein
MEQEQLNSSIIIAIIEWFRAMSANTKITEVESRRGRICMEQGFKSKNAS